MTDEFRPATWDQFIGQRGLKERLAVHIDAAYQDQRTLDHVLLCGPPGFGKTSLATIIATKMWDNLYSLTMPVDERAFIRYLVHTVDTGILLLDEIHRCPVKQQETLLPLLETGVYYDSRGRAYEFDAVTIVGATTERHKLIAPLVDRFPIKPDFVEYTDEELGAIALGMAGKIGVVLAPEDSCALGAASGGIPRNVRSYVLAARDLAHKLGRSATASEILAFVEVDPDGLTMGHGQYLGALATLGGTAGLRPLSDYLQLNETEIRGLERLLLRKNLLTYSERGRELTTAGVQRVRASR